jgi:RNA polymerase sigma factor
MNLNEKVSYIKIENKDRSLFIEEHQNFIIGKVTKITNRYISKENDEAFLIGLEAFNEAITRFESAKGNFLPFAGFVIQSRITDWMRKEKKNRERYLPLNHDEIADGGDLEFDFLLKEEVFNMKYELTQFGITFDDLVDIAPKKLKTLRKVTTIGRDASKNQMIVKTLYKTRKLPMNDISTLVRTTLKVLKTHRDFIVTVMVVITKKFEIVGSFLLETEEG